MVSFFCFFFFFSSRRRHTRFDCDWSSDVCSSDLSSAAEAERLSADGQDMLDRIARFPKPIAVGIHGACLGGGFEFALACHYRVATDHPKTQIGLPEVQLGILPGAGGGPRPPRALGARAALDN